MHVLITYYFAEHIWHISILKKELGMNANLIGMTGLCLCDKKVSIMKYPTKSKEQKSMDIMVFIKYLYTFIYISFIIKIIFVWFYYSCQVFVDVELWVHFFTWK